MNIDMRDLFFGFSKFIHFLNIAIMVWLIIVSYTDPRIISELYSYLFNDISFRKIPELIGMRSDAEIAYFLLSNYVISVLHLNLVFMYATKENLREEWLNKKEPLSEILNKNLWARFWPHYSIRVFRWHNHHYENELGKAISMLLRDETYIDLPGVILVIVILYPLLYSSLSSSDFLSIFGWQLITPIFILVFWNQVLSMSVLYWSLIKGIKEK